jgi:hypothetical protein
MRIATVSGLATPHDAPMRRLGNWPLYPVVFAISWVLATVVDSGVRLQATVRVLVVVPLLAAIVLVACVATVRHRHLGGILALAILVLLASRDFGRFGLALVGIVAVALAIVIVRRIMSRPLVAGQLTVVGNLISVLLLATVVVQGLGNGTLPAWVGDLSEQPPVVGAAAGSGQQDIYLILLDGYPRADTVRDVLVGDNTAFVEQLELRSFSVDPMAHSGYQYTDLAVSSMLHGRHLVDIPELENVLAGERRPALGRQVLNQAPVLEQLADRGYTLFANAQAWDEPAIRSVHWFVEGSGLNEFERHLLLESLPGAVWQAIDPAIRQDLMRPWVEDAFDFVEMAAAKELDGPRFVFTHVPSPHFPIVYAADGSPADPGFGTDHPSQVTSFTLAQTKEAYLGQVEYLNRQLLALLDSRSIADDAIVIVMSDHGPEFGLDWENGAESDLRTRHATLFAARAPAGVFGPGQDVTSILVRALNGVVGAAIAEPSDRFFANASSPKYATLTEIADPWSD